METLQRPPEVTLTPRTMASLVVSVTTYHGTIINGILYERPIMDPRGVTLLWNEHTRRLRLPWRLVALLVALFVLSIVITTAVDVVFTRSIDWLLVLFTPGQSVDQAVVAARGLVFVSSQALVMVGSVYLVGRFVDRRRFRDFGFHVDRSWWVDLGFGLALGAVLMTGIFCVQLLAGWVQIRDLFWIARSDFSFWSFFGLSFGTYVTVGIYEEVLARGYLIKNLAEGLTWFDQLGATRAVGLATLGSALVFGVGHFTNPNASVASTVGIVFAAVMLAAGYVLTGELAIPIGLHISWNFFQGTVYGFPVSGTSHGVSLIAIDQTGPPVVTGGAFGPEAGVIGVIATTIGLGLITAWVRWRDGHIGIDPSTTTPDLRIGAAD